MVFLKSLTGPHVSLSRRMRALRSPCQKRSTSDHQVGPNGLRARVAAPHAAGDRRDEKR